MSPTTMTQRRSTGWVGVLVGLLLAAAMALLAAPTGAYAAGDAPDTPGADQEKTDYYFGGVITFDDEPVADVTVAVEGGGFEAETVTGADGRWRLYVPEKDTYTLTVDESTLPDGVIVEGESASQEVEFGLTGSKIVNLFLGEGVRQTTSFVDQLVERIFNGLNFGLLLALAAIGVSLIFGTTGLTNFAHAEMVTFGAIIAIVMGTFWQVPMWITIPVVVIVGAAFGWTLDAGLWRPLRRRGIGLVPLMIVSIGLSLALRYLYQYFFTGSTYQLPGAGSTRLPLFGAVQLSPVSLMSMGISIVVIVAVALWLLRTRVGKATRAISDNPGLAAASGFDVDRVVRIVWMMAAALAALAGILWGYFRPGVRWDMGVHILLLIFAAVTLGGLGTAFGALVGALIVGLLVEVSTLWLPSDLKYVGALVVLILILLVRPQGILGRKERLG